MKKSACYFSIIKLNLRFVFSWYHGTIIRADIMFKKILLQKPIAYCINLKKRATRSLPDHQTAKNLIFVFGFYGQKGDKSEFAATFLGII